MQAVHALYVKKYSSPWVVIEIVPERDNFNPTFNIQGQEKVSVGALNLGRSGCVFQPDIQTSDRLKADRTYPFGHRRHPAGFLAMTSICSRMLSSPRAHHFSSHAKECFPPMPDFNCKILPTSNVCLIPFHAICPRIAYNQGSYKQE